MEKITLHAHTAQNVMYHFPYYATPLAILGGKESDTFFGLHAWL